MAEPWTRSRDDHDEPIDFNIDPRSKDLLRLAADNLSQREHRINALEGEIRALNDKLHERNCQYDQLKTTVNRLRTGEGQIQALLRDRTAELSALRSSQSVTQREQQALLEAQRLELEATRNLAHDKQTELKLTQVQLHQLQDKLKEREQMVSEANLTLQAADTQIGILEQKMEMMEKEFQGRQQSLELKHAESEAALVETRQQYQGAMTSRAVLESQIESLKISHDKLLTEFKTTATTMSDKWASAQLQFFKDTDQAITRLHKRIEAAIQCQSGLTQLLQNSVNKCRLLADKLDRRSQRVLSLKSLLSRDLTERCKAQKAYEIGLLKIDRLSQHLRAAEKKAAHRDLIVEELNRRLNQAVSERTQSDAENEKLRSALNIAEEKMDLITKLNDEMKCEIALQRNLIERQLTEERGRELALHGEVALHQSARRQAERQLKEQQTRCQTMMNNKADIQSNPSSGYDHVLLQTLQHSNIHHNGAYHQSQSQWYEELLDKMNGLICQVDESIVNAGVYPAENQNIS